MPGNCQEMYSERSAEPLSDGVLGPDTELHDEVHPQSPHSGHGGPTAEELVKQLHGDDLPGGQNGK